MSWDVIHYPIGNDSVGVIKDYKISTIVNLILPLLQALFSILLINKSNLISDFVVPNNLRSKLVSKVDEKIFCLMMVTFIAILSLYKSLPFFSSIMSTLIVLKENVLLFNYGSKVKLLSDCLSFFILLICGVICYFFRFELVRNILNKK